MERKPVVVTTAHKGVFFGLLEEEEGKVITLSEARCCIYWPPEVKGFVGLAVTGPLHGSRVGPAAPRLKLHDVTAVLDCTEEAVERWRAEPWD